MALRDKIQFPRLKKFQGCLGLQGVIITKLDSTSKAGFAISVSYDYDLPIKFIGVGEKIEDLIPLILKNLEMHF